MIARRQFDQTKKGKLRTSVVRECLVALTGSSRTARILDQFLYWAERVNDVDRYIQEEKARCEQTGGTFDAPLTHGWIYKAAVELIDEIMLDESEQTVRKDITLLVEWGYLSQRSNPTHKWDRTIQYRVNLLKIQEDLQEIGYALEGYPLLRENQGNLQNGESKRGIRESKRESGGAIPEHTVETTLEHKENVFHAARGAEQQSLLDEDKLTVEQPKKGSILVDSSKRGAKSKQPSQKPPIPREPDLLFDAIAETWKTAPGMTGKIKQQLTGNIPANSGELASNFDQPATPDEVRAFGQWYAKKCINCDMPLSRPAIQTHFYAFRRAHAAHERQNAPKVRYQNGRKLIYNSDSQKWYDVGPDDRDYQEDYAS